MEQSGAQTLYKGLIIIEAIVNGHRSLKKISTELGMSKSTAHRLLSVLVQMKYLRQRSNEYSLGPRLIEYGMRSLGDYPLRSAAVPFLKELSNKTLDTVHLGIREEMEVFYIDKISGTRAVDMNSRVGFRMPLDITGVGKALLLDCSVRELKDIRLFYKRPEEDLPGFLEKMKFYKMNGYTLDFAENEINIRCIAAPVRNASNSIVAAISVASMANYMPEERMQELTSIVKETADSISLQLGWSVKNIYPK